MFFFSGNSVIGSVSVRILSRPLKLKSHQQMGNKSSSSTPSTNINTPPPTPAPLNPPIQVTNHGPLADGSLVRITVERVPPSTKTPNIDSLPTGMRNLPSGDDLLKEASSILHARCRASPGKDNDYQCNHLRDTLWCSKAKGLFPKDSAIDRVCDDFSTSLSNSENRYSWRAGYHAKQYLEEKQVDSISEQAAIIQDLISKQNRIWKIANDEAKRRGHHDIVAKN